MRFSTLSKILSAALVLGSVSNARALPLDDAATVRPNFTVGGFTFDGNGSDAINAFDNFSGNEFLRFGNVSDTTSAGVKYEIYFLTEVAFYDGHQLPGSANKFGTVMPSSSSISNFQTRLDSNTVDPGTGVAATFTTSPGDQFELAMLSPEGELYNANDDANTYGAPHILGKRVTSAGTVTLQSGFTLSQTISFNLLVGDLVLFVEDETDVNSPADLDYNDMVLVIRQTPITSVPEPGSMILLLSGLGAAGIRRRKLSAK